MRNLLAVVAFACLSVRPSAAAEAPASAPAGAAAAPRPASAPGETSVALGEALSTIGKPEVLGVFAFVPERDVSTAFADLLTRDKKAMKRYAARLSSDIKSAGGLSAWDHEVCATLVNYYASPLSGGAEKPDAKRTRIINECVLSPVMTLQDVMIRRSK